MIRETKNALSEKIDTLKRQNIQPFREELCEKSIPSMKYSIYASYLPFGKKCVDFLVDESDYAWFEISSICKAFNVKPDIFESKSENFGLTDSPRGPKSFVCEMDIFKTPLVDKSEFTDWYSNYAVPRITSFIVNRKDYNENKYGRVLSLEFHRLREALLKNIEKLKEHETLNE
ncbi:hypothetical protein AVEN_227443-1 [Araneus ventricosus]|uniref:Uncharacterized protein n=1 Tax=Araneus ventricosus TaxID=182803 RepID=A0A4Y2U9B1_ARAVE|nr:hypothetical protein AVEN_227443-1 [Araneus ventricosus]